MRMEKKSSGAEDRDGAIFAARRQKLAAWMRENEIKLVCIEDFEEHRDPSLRYLCGMPGDALLFMNDDGASILAPWDEIMAGKMAFLASADKIMLLTRFKNDRTAAISAAVSDFGLKCGDKIEFSAKTAHTVMIKRRETLDGYEVLCREGGLDNEILKFRSIKDAVEIEIYKKCAELTDEITFSIVENVKDGKFLTEADVALFIERRARELGCEGTGFGTLCAGPERSFAIHCFPGWTSSPFAARGLSILDYGLAYRGYTSDVTVTFARSPLSSAQEEMLALVEKAAEIAFDNVGIGESAKKSADAVGAHFAAAGRAMPHSLGHGIGFEAHEAPYLSEKTGASWILQPGMVFTIEPGLYDSSEGGCRLENDILLTEDGPARLTNTKIVRL
jgi:Xaa-Pro dipeptidase